MQLCPLGFVFGSCLIEDVGQTAGTPAAPASQGAAFVRCRLPVFDLELAVGPQRGDVRLEARAGAGWGELVLGLRDESGGA